MTLIICNSNTEHQLMVSGNYVNVIPHQNLEFLADNMHAARICINSLTGKYWFIKAVETQNNYKLAQTRPTCMLSNTHSGI